MARLRIIRSAQYRLRKLIKWVFRFDNEHYQIDHRSIEELSKRYRRSRAKFIASYIFCSYVYGCDFRQYMLFEMYKLKHFERKQFITRYNKFKLYNAFNIRGRDKRAFFDDKRKFNQAFASFIRREWLYGPEHSREEVLAFIRKHGRVIVKPTGLMGGKGIFLISAEDADSAFLSRVCKEGLLLEQYVEQCRELSALNASSVNTVRVVCVRDGSGQVHILSAALRVGKPGCPVDNLSAGGVLYPLNEDAGFVSDAGVDASGIRYCHQGGHLMLGFQVPRWPEITAAARQAMDVFPDIRLVAWDFCVTPCGVELIEGNLVPGARSLQADQVGRREILRRLLV